MFIILFKHCQYWITFYFFRDEYTFNITFIKNMSLNLMAEEENNH